MAELFRLVIFFNLPRWMDFSWIFPWIPYMVSDVFWMDFSMDVFFLWICFGINGVWFSCEVFKKLAGLSYEI